MYKLVAIYKVPEDKEAFEKHYKEVHTPLSMKVPHMKEFRVSRVFGSPMGESEYYLQAEMCFASKDDFKAAMKTPEAAESGKDAMKFAGHLVKIFFAEESVERLA